MKARRRNFGKAEMAGWLDGKTAIPMEHLRLPKRPRID
jgi:hypothetical protein